MKKQNTLAFLVRNLEAWPTEAKHAPVINGYIWTIGIGGIVLFDEFAMKCQSMAEATINRKEWLVAQLDSVTAKSGVEVKQDSIAKSYIGGIKNGDIDIQPVVNAINKEAGLIIVNAGHGSIEKSNLSQDQLLEKVTSFDTNTNHTPCVRLTSHEKAVIADAWDTHKSIPDYKPLSKTKNEIRDQLKSEINSMIINAGAGNAKPKPKQKIYISGPMTSHDSFNRPAFNSTSDALSLAGYIVLNPAILPDGLTQAQYMQIDLTMLQCCDAIFMLKNWDDSAGAMAEHALAMKLGLKVIHEVDLCQE
tara:strand:+ start:1384 stop:2298 length:915 start_codon:yes stop_codon:yes gene_type:complete